MALPEPYARCSADVRHEGVHDGGFANAGFARDEDDLALALARLRPGRLQGGQSRLALHEGQRRTPRVGRPGHGGRARPDPSGGQGGRLGRWRLQHGHRGHKAIAIPMRGGNKLGGPHPIPEGLAQVGNADFQDHIAHGGLRPDGIQERCLRDELPGMLHEILQDGKRFGFQRDGHRVLPEAPIPRVETERAKHPLDHHRHGVDLSPPH